MNLRLWFVVVAVGVLAPGLVLGDEGATVDMVDVIKENTYQHHTGRETNAVYLPATENGSENEDGSQESQPQFSTDDFQTQYDAQDSQPQDDTQDALYGTGDSQTLYDTQNSQSQEDGQYAQPQSDTDEWQSQPDTQDMQSDAQDSQQDSGVDTLPVDSIAAPSGDAPDFQLQEDSDGMIQWDSQNLTSLAPLVAGPIQYEAFTENTAPIAAPQEKSHSFPDSWAAPTVVVLFLLLAAGVGLFVVHRRRKAARYHGLHEAELGEVRRPF